MNATVNRDPRGIPTGGRFAKKLNGEDDSVTIGDTAAAEAPEWFDREGWEHFGVPLEVATAFRDLDTENLYHWDGAGVKDYLDGGVTDPEQIFKWIQMSDHKTVKPLIEQGIDADWALKMRYELGREPEDIVDVLPKMKAVGLTPEEVSAFMSATEYDYRNPKEHKSFGESAIALKEAFGTPAHYQTFRTRSGYSKDWSDGWGGASGDPMRDSAMLSSFANAKEANAYLKVWAPDLDMFEPTVYEEVTKWHLHGPKDPAAGSAWFRTGSGHETDPTFRPEVAKMLHEAGYRAPAIWGPDDRSPGSKLPDEVTVQAAHELFTKRQGKITGQEIVDELTSQLTLAF